MILPRKNQYLLRRQKGRAKQIGNVSVDTQPSHYIHCNWDEIRYPPPTTNTLSFPESSFSNCVSRWRIRVIDFILIRSRYLNYAFFFSRYIPHCILPRGKVQARLCLPDRFRMRHCLQPRAPRGLNFSFSCKLQLLFLRARLCSSIPTPFFSIRSLSYSHFSMRACNFCLSLCCLCVLLSLLYIYAFVAVVYSYIFMKFVYIAGLAISVDRICLYCSYRRWPESLLRYRHIQKILHQKYNSLQRSREAAHSKASLWCADYILIYLTVQYITNRTITYSSAIYTRSLPTNLPLFASYFSA